MYIADIFSKINQVSLSLLGKQWTVFIVNDKIQAFKQKLEFWKTYICCCDLDSFLKTKDSSDKWLLILTRVIFGTV